MLTAFIGLFLLSTGAVNTDITYTKDVKPIFQNRCAQCHNERWKSANWLDYKTAFKNRASIKRRVWLERSMPPSVSMLESERVTIKDWIDQGAKE